MKHQSKAVFVLFLYLILLSKPSFSESVSTQSTDLFQQGKQAYSEKQYERALGYFLKAEQKKGASAVFDYNVAVCFLKLKQYSQAKFRFTNLSGYQDWEGLAYYHLAQIAESEGDQESAVLFYTKTLDAKQEKLQKIAKVKLKNLEAQADKKRQVSNNDKENKKISSTNTNEKKQKKATGILSASLGLDSNAASLADELIESNSQAEDRYTSLLAYAQYYVTGKRNDGVKIYGLGFNRAYQEFESLSSRVVGVGAAYERPWRSLQFSYGLRGTSTSVDGVRVANQLQAKLQLSKKIKGHSLMVSYSPSQINASEQYAQINGRQHRIEGSWQFSREDVRFKLRYRHEINDRDNYTQDEFYSSASPTRTGLKGELKWDASENLQLALGVEVIDSTYTNENRMRDIGGVVRSEKRKSEKSAWEISGRYEILKNTYAKLFYKYTDNQDGFDVYNYEKKDLGATLEFRF